MDFSLLYSTTSKSEANRIIEQLGKSTIAVKTVEAFESAPEIVHQEASVTQWRLYVYEGDLGRAQFILEHCQKLERDNYRDWKVWLYVCLFFLVIMAIYFFLNHIV